MMSEEEHWAAMSEEEILAIAAQRRSRAEEISVETAERLERNERLAGLRPGQHIWMLMIENEDLRREIYELKKEMQDRAEQVHLANEQLRKENNANNEESLNRIDGLTKSLNEERTINERKMEDMKKITETEKEDNAIIVRKWQEILKDATTRMTAQMSVLKDDAAAKKNTIDEITARIQEKVVENAKLTEQLKQSKAESDRLNAVVLRLGSAAVMEVATSRPKLKNTVRGSAVFDVEVVQSKPTTGRTTTLPARDAPPANNDPLGRKIGRIRHYRECDRAYGDWNDLHLPSELDRDGSTRRYDIALRRGGTLGLRPRMLSNDRRVALSESMRSCKFYRQYARSGVYNEPRFHVLLSSVASSSMKALPIDLVPEVASYARELAALYDLPDDRWDIGVDLIAYRDGDDSIGWHADDTQGESVVLWVVVDAPGEPMPVHVRPNVRTGPLSDGDEEIQLYVGEGDGYDMDGTMQSGYEHRLPKRRDCGAHSSVDIDVSLKEVIKEAVGDLPLALLAPLADWNGDTPPVVSTPPDNAVVDTHAATEFKGSILSLAAATNPPRIGNSGVVTAKEEEGGKTEQMTRVRKRCIGIFDRGIVLSRKKKRLASSLAKY